MDLDMFNVEEPKKPDESGDSVEQEKAGDPISQAKKRMEDVEIDVTNKPDIAKEAPNLIPNVEENTSAALNFANIPNEKKGSIQLREEIKEYKDDEKLRTEELARDENGDVASVEVAEENIEEANTKRIKETAEHIAQSSRQKQTPKERNSRANEIEEILGAINENGETNEMVIYTKINKIFRLKSPEKREIAKQQLLEEMQTEMGLSFVEAEIMYRRFLENPDLAKEAADIKTFEEALRKRGAVDEDMLKLAKALDNGDEKYVEKFIKDNFDDKATINRLLGYRELAKFSASQIAALEATKANEQKPKKTKSELEKGLKRDGTYEKYEGLSLSEEDTAAFEELSEEGATPIISNIIKNGLHKSDNGFEGLTDAGVVVEIDTAIRQMRLIGDHAGDTGRNKLPDPYVIDPPSINNLDRVILRMVVKESNVDALAEPGMENLLLTLGAKISEDPRGNNVMMQEDGKNRFHNFVDVMFRDANGNVMLRLQNLGILRPPDEGGQGFEINMQRLEKIRDAFALYTPRRLDEQSSHDSSFNYHHFHVLTELWDVLGGETKFPPASELMSLAEKLPKKGKKRTKLIKEHAIEMGYMKEII